MVQWLLRRDILGVAGRAGGSDVQQSGSASWVHKHTHTHTYMYTHTHAYTHKHKRPHTCTTPAMLKEVSRMHEDNHDDDLIVMEISDQIHTRAQLHEAKNAATLHVLETDD